jgi:hypothetical protein
MSQGHQTSKYILFTKRRIETDRLWIV